MSAAALVADLERAGVTLAVSGDRLRWQAPEGVMTAAMVDALRRHKADVMAAIGDADGVGTPSEQIFSHVRITDPDALAAWGDARAAVEWFLASEPPAEPFVLRWGDRGVRPAVTITDPRRFWRDLKTDIAAGPGLGRDHVGAVRADLKRLYGIFGGGS